MSYTPDSKIEQIIVTNVQLNEIQDVNIINPQNNQILIFNGSQWVNNNITATINNVVGNNIQEFYLERLDTIADNTDIAYISSYALDSTNIRTEFTRIIFRSLDFTNNTEDSSIIFQVLNSGNLQSRFVIANNYIQSVNAHRFASGSQTTPGITFTNDLDTGLFYNGANQIGFTTGGINRIILDDVGILKYSTPPVLTSNLDIINKSYVDDLINLQTLSDLNDVIITSPTLNEVLKYDGSNWINGSISSSGFGIWKGIWNSSSSYVVNDVVEYLGSSYICIVNNINNPPPNSNWEIVASVGAAGTNVTIENNSIITGTANTINFSSEFNCIDAGSGQIDVNLSSNVNKFFAYNNTILSTTSATFIPIPLNVEIRKDSIFVHNTDSSDITVNKTGWFEIIVNGAYRNSSNNSRTITESSLFVNNIQIDAAQSYAYHRTSTQGQGSYNITRLIQLNSGDVVSLRLRRISGTGTIQTIEGGTRIYIKEVF